MRVGGVRGGGGGSAERRAGCGYAVELPGGTLDVRWGGEGEAVWMAGPTAWVFDSEIEL